MELLVKWNGIAGVFFCLVANGPFWFCSNVKTKMGDNDATFGF
ncbi:hypothetical protein C8N36_104150 [Pelagimonas varians]|uniref:Uncharacterized protein n=1 Tax=Pelagimonas varians TaxID=696760 RepID=A0A238K8C0_9RHOB|nr:hypothetical protein C8N36_104150 [Pelagimonas varians]SMX38694.1 hypothetical protein PEV8663_01494 [Pelagimonas varians]